MANIANICDTNKASEENDFKRISNIGILVYQGGLDDVVDNPIINRVYEHIPGSNKKLIFKPKLGHTPMSHGVYKNEAIEDIDKWFGKYL